MPGQPPPAQPAVGCGGQLCRRYRRYTQAMASLLGGSLWPCTIIPARYGGTYEGGEWLAFALDYSEMPEDVYSGDVYCASFFHSTDLPIGRGGNPQEAYEDLLKRLELS